MYDIRFSMRELSENREPLLIMEEILNGSNIWHYKWVFSLWLSATNHTDIVRYDGHIFQ